MWKVFLIGKDYVYGIECIPQNPWKSDIFLFSGYALFKNVREIKQQD